MLPGLLLLATLAQEPPPDIHPPPIAIPAPEPEAPLQDARVLVQFGLVLGGGIENVAPRGLAPGLTFAEPLGAAGIGLELGIGVQVNDEWGFGPEIGAGTSVVYSFGRAALSARYSPARWLTASVGPVGWVDTTSIRGCPAFGCGAGTAEAVGGTVRIDLHLAVERHSPRRSALTIGVITDCGATLHEDTRSAYGAGVAWGVYLAFGYAYY